MDPQPTPEFLRVTSQADLSRRGGHPPGSAYITTVWLGVLGPSTTLCWERLARLVTARDEAVIDSRDLAMSLGLGNGLGRNSPLSRTLSRMVNFGAAQREPEVLRVRQALDDVTPRQLDRLSRSAHMAHERWTMATPHLASPPVDHRTPAVEL